MANSRFNEVQRRAFHIAARMRACGAWDFNCASNFVETVRTIESVEFWEGQAAEAEKQAAQNDPSDYGTCPEDAKLVIPR